MPFLAAAKVHATSHDAVSDAARPATIVREVAISQRGGDPVERALRERCKAALIDTHTLAERLLGRTLPVPTLGFDLRGKVGGKAYLHRWHVQLNGGLLDRNEKEYLEQVIPHELAHLYCFALYGSKGRGHGEPWQRMMALLGKPAHRTHCMDTSETRVAVRLYRYACSCKTHELSARKHGLLLKPTKKDRQKGVRRVLCCKQCDEALQFTGYARMQGQWVCVPATESALARSRKARPASPVAGPRTPRQTTLGQPAKSAPTLLQQLQRLIAELNAQVPPSAYTDPAMMQSIVGLLTHRRLQIKQSGS